MKKNILLITADQWRGDCLSALGHPHVKTPNFDELIADGIAFDHHYSVCVPCGPARASLLTGMYLQNHRVARNGTPFDNRYSNIAKEVRKAGYTPTLFGYTDTALDPRYNSENDVLRHGYEGMMPGFEEGLLLPASNPEKWLEWLREKGYNFNTVAEARSPENMGQEDREMGRAGYPLSYKAEHSQAAFLTQHVIDYIDQYNSDGAPSWCIHLSYQRPHPPFLAPEPYNQMYNPDLIESIEARRDYIEDHAFLQATQGALGDWAEPWIQQLSADATTKEYEKEVRQLRATYYGLISKVDHYVGQLIDHLKEVGEYDNTLIIMTSDHAELMGDHGLFGKCGFYKESYHIPLIIRDPNQTKRQRGQIEKSITESVDIMPTILDWIDQPIPRQCDGKSLLSFIDGSTGRRTQNDWRQEAHWEYDFHDTRSSGLEYLLGLDTNDCKFNVISNDDYMFVYFASLPALFFDLRKDPKAESNVVDEPEYASLVLEFSQRLLTWRMQNDERILTGYSISPSEIFHRDD